MSEGTAEGIAPEDGSLPENRGRSLSRDQEKEAFAAYLEGLNYREIGEVYGVDWGTVRKAVLRLDPEAARGPRPTETDRDEIYVGLRAVTAAARKLPPETRKRVPRAAENARLANLRKTQNKLENAERFREKVRRQRAQEGKEARIAEAERMARAQEVARGARSVQEKILTAPAGSLPEHERPQELRLDTVPPTNRRFVTAEDGARWVINNFDEVDSHFLEAVEEGAVSDGILHAFLVQIGGFSPTLMTDREQIPTVLKRDSVGYLVELVEAIGKGGYSDEVKEEFASGLAGLFELYGLPFNPEDERMPPWMMGRIRRFRARRAKRAEVEAQAKSEGETGTD